jgi:hypothetical protein
VPVKVTEAVDAAVPEAAVRVVVCAVPGVRVSVAGFAVTPEGRPVRATETALLKEFVPVASTLTGIPVAPATIVNEVGVRASVKPAGGPLVVRETVAEWLKVPEVPVRVRVALPAATVEAAVNVTFCAVPGVKVNEAGLAVTPVGNPLSATDTEPVNPLVGVALTLIA